MSAVLPADSTLVAIRKKVRRLTASASESSLSTADIDQYINTYYSQDFPYSIKLDQMRNVYTFFTEPYRDRYPLDVNYDQGVRAPIYVEGIQGSFMKDRQQFFSLWPKFPTKFQQGTTSLSGTITAITNSVLGGQAQVTSASNNLIVGAVISIDNVVGMTELNQNPYTVVSIVDPNNFLINVDTSTYTPYSSGGTWTSNNQDFSFNIPSPFLSKECVIGGIDSFGNPITINDDGNGNLIYLVPNPVTSTPAALTNPAIPGMYNVNLNNPGLNNPTLIGTVNYVTGQFDFQLPIGISLATGTLFTVWVSQYQTGRPYSLLFWNNEFTIRPVPKLIHKVEVETYLTPVQFLNTTDSPILNQWWQLIAIGAAIKVLEDRQDMEGVQNLVVLFDRQAGLVLERQGVEEIFQPNITLFNSVGGYNMGSIGPWGNNGSW